MKDRAAEIMKDSMAIEPKTETGAMVRRESQAQSARITSTNENWLASGSLYVKNWLNKFPGGVRLGDLIVPIAKIPTTALYNGLDNAGAGIPKGLKDIIQGQKLIGSADEAQQLEGLIQFGNGVQRLSRIVGTLSATALLASTLTKKDFKSDNYGNHFVMIGGEWINMQYVEAISPAFAGMMSVKENEKTDQSFVSTAWQYSSGGFSSLKSAPGIGGDEVTSLVNSLSNKDWKKGPEKYLNTFGKSRVLPAMIQNLWKDRVENRLFFGATGVETPEQQRQDVINSKKAKK